MITADQYSECAQAKKKKLIGWNLPAQLPCGPCWTNEGKDETNCVHLQYKQFIYKGEEKYKYNNQKGFIRQYVQQGQQGFVGCGKIITIMDKMKRWGRAKPI